MKKPKKKKAEFKLHFDESLQSRTILFKPSAIVSYSAEGFGGVIAAQHMRLVFAKLGALQYPLFLRYLEQEKLFDEVAKLVQEQYNKRITRFLDDTSKDSKIKD